MADGGTDRIVGDRTGDGLPLLIPTFQGSGLFQGGIGKGGNDKVQITNPVLDLRRNLSLGLDVELLRLRTDDPDPAYLRIGVLDKFDGEWKPSPRDIPASQRANGALLTRSA